MQSGYTLMMTFDELMQMPDPVKAWFAQRDQSFARIAGVPTEANPPAQPQKQMVMGPNGPMIPADRDQPNQQNSPAWNSGMGTAGNFTGPQIPNIPSGVPNWSPPQSQLPGAMNSPMPQSGMMGSMPGFPPQHGQPQFPPQGQPQVQVYNPVNQQVQQGGPQLTPQWIRDTFVPQKVQEWGGAHVLVGKLQQAVQEGILPRPHMDVIDPSNIQRFYELLNR